MLVRLAVIMTLAACLAPGETLNRFAQLGYDNARTIATVCERRREECDLIAEKLKQTGVLISGHATRAAVELRTRVENSVRQMRHIGVMSALERGTLQPEDLEPDWRGS
ncbi:MAG: hypothetical protein KJ622_06235 [Alphaproteobacteria bacterium]|nr:hypothetical protein [Alphaproteobacteria bacterium]